MSQVLVLVLASLVIVIVLVLVDLVLVLVLACPVLVNIIKNPSASFYKALRQFHERGVHVHCSDETRLNGLNLMSSHKK